MNPAALDAIRKSSDGNRQTKPCGRTKKTPHNTRAITNCRHRQYLCLGCLHINLTGYAFFFCWETRTHTEQKATGNTSHSNNICPLLVYANTRTHARNNSAPTPSVSHPPTRAKKRRKNGHTNGHTHTSRPLNLHGNAQIINAIHVHSHRDQATDRPRHCPTGPTGRSATERASSFCRM